MDIALKEAIKRRDDFLEEHPELKDYQRDLDISLSGVKDPMLRISIIMGKISKNMERITEECENIKKLKEV